MDQLIDQFLVEGRELVQQAADDLTALADRPDSAPLIDAVFRAVHTLKGSTGLFDLQPFGEMLHAAEDLLGALRKQALAADADIIGTLVLCVDQAARWLDAVEAHGNLPPDAREVGLRLQRDLRRWLVPLGSAVPAPAEAVDRSWLDPFLAAQTGLPDGGLVAIRYAPRDDCFFTGDDPVAVLRAVPGLCTLRLGTQQPWAPADAFDPYRCNLIFEVLTTASRTEVQAALRLVADQVQIVEVARRPVEADVVRDGAPRSLRIDAGQVDALGTIADEIVVANNALAHLAAQARRGVTGDVLVQGLLANQLDLDRLVGRLHRAVMRVRLMPLASLFQRFPRLMREIGAKLGKDVGLAIEGETIEVDKSLVDGLFDPLLHLLRNAADHGIEPAATRRAAGKAARGTIRLNAQRRGDQVVIEIADDGKGIDPADLRRTALKRGLMTAAALAGLSDADALDLIFAPGFSTAETVTDLSGRGVGMDVVRTAVLRLGGRIALSSLVGTGTTVRLSLPVSVVLSNVIVVACAGDSYGVPMDMVVETVRIPAERVLAVRNGRAFVLRDAVVPVLELAALLGQTTGGSPGDLRLLVVRRPDGLVAVAVDDFTDRLNLLLRPMSGLLAGMPGVAGTAVLGDGRVLMILDLPELIG